LVNLPGGLVDMQSDVGIGNYQQTEMMVNQGTVRKSGGSGTSVISPILSNSGTVDAESGTLSLNNGNGAGLFLTGAGATLAYTGTYTIDPGGQLAGTGTNLLSSGTFTLNGSMTASNAVLAAGTLGGTNGVLGGTWIWKGGTIAAGSTLTVATNGLVQVTGNGTTISGTLTNAGTIRLVGAGLTLSGNGLLGLVNLPGGLVDMQSDVGIGNYQQTEMMVNQGTVRKSGGSGTSAIQPRLNNSGTLDAQSGTLNLSGSYTLTGGTLNFGLSGATSFGKINLAGAAALTGTLSANLINSFLPLVGSSFTLITFGSETGAFNNFSLPALGAGLGWQVIYGASAVSVQVVANAGFTNLITGVVTNTLGTPVTNLTVFAYTTNSGGNIFLSTTTDAQGNYVLSVSNSVWRVGLQGLIARNYDNVPTQDVFVNGANAVANFVVQPYSGLIYTIAAANNPPNGGTIFGAGTAFYGATNVLTAQPNPGYNFGWWSEGGTIVGSNPTLLTVVDANHSFVANYTEANPVHFVSTATSPSGVASVAGAGVYTNGQTANFSAPPVVVSPPFDWFFQKYTLTNSLVSTNASFTKIFSTVDASNLLFVAVYASLPTNPVVTNILANYPALVPATTNFVIVFQFDRVMNTNITPLVVLTNTTPGAIQPGVPAGGYWASGAELNDTFYLPPVTFSQGMSGGVSVLISGAQDTLGVVLAQTNVDSFTVDAEPPVLSNIAAAPGVLTTFVTWNSDKAASSLVEYGATSAYGFSSGLYGQLVNAHGITLYGLSPLTQYHYRVRSRDLAGNETISGDSLFTTLAAPDLAMTNLSVSGNFVSGGNLLIAWQDTNAGVGATFTYWYDQVIVTNTTTGQTLLNTVVFYDPNANGNIAGGDDRNRQFNFNLPDGSSGAGNLQISVTANVYGNQFEANGSGNALLNNTASITQTTTLAAYPDLQVVGLAVTNSQIRSGGVVGLAWQDTNSGSGSVKNLFYDQITVVNQTTSQTLVNTMQSYDASVAPIAGGQAANRQFSFTLPDGTPGVGTLRITLTVDANNQVYEFNTGGTAEINNTNSITAVSSLAAYADLAVTNVTGPGSTGAGQSVSVSWVDSNLGNGDATNNWYDQIFLSSSNAIGGGQYLGSFLVTNALAAGQSVTNTQTVTLPQFIQGNEWLIVSANASASFFELNTSNNSGIAAQAIVVNPTLQLGLSQGTVSESAGANTVTGTLIRNGDVSGALLVQLASASTTNVTLPATVTIPVGQSAVSFPIGVTDQFIAGGAFAETISATANAFPPATAGLTILYDDVAALTLSLNTNAIPEDAAHGTAMGMVTRNANFGQPLIVTLISDLPSALTVPDSVQIPAGQASASFDLTPVNDNVVGDTRRVHLSAGAAGYSPVSATIDVLNVNTVNLTLALANSTVAKGAPSPATIGTVTRTPVSSSAQNVMLTVSDNSLVTVPDIVTIPAGAASVSFNVNVGDDGLATGPQNATLVAQVLTPNWQVETNGQNSATLMILDTHGPTLALTFAKNSIAKGSNSTVTVTRNTPPTNSLTVNLSATPADVIAFPASVVIPQNQFSATFAVTGVLDNSQTGPRNVALTASATGFNSGVGNLTVSDIYYADLTPTSITIPTNAMTSQQITVGWVVANHGLTGANGAWYDFVYLASDSLGQQQTLVAFETNASPLAIGASYTNQTSFYLPQVPGNYWVVVATDAGNAVSEINKQNNTGITPMPIVVNPAYRATLTGVSPAVAAVGTPITFSGRMFNPLDNSPVAFSPATVRVLINAMRRVYTVTSDANGNFSYTFQPLAHEAGDYTAGADYPLVNTDSNQVSFVLLGMQAFPDNLTAQLLPNTPLVGQMIFSNLTDQTLTGLAVSVPDLQGNLAAQFTFTNTTLPGNGTVTVGYQLQSPLTRTAQIKFSMTATSAEGAQLTIPATVQVVPLVAQLAANPAYLARGMLVGTQTLVSFDLVNSGGAASGDLTLQLPATLPWMKLSSPATIPSIPAGGKATVILTLNPPSDLPLTLYQGSLAAANNNTGISIPFQFRAVSSGQGDLRVTATDDYTYYVDGAPKVTNATVTVRDAITTAVIAQTNTDANGIAYFAGLPEGSYTVDAAAPEHNQYCGSASVVTGTTNDLEAFMPRQLVSYQWTVVPTEIPDEYKIQLESVFETEVPVPNVVVEQPQVMLFVFPNEAAQVNITLRNEGLIAAQGVTITPPNDPDYIITPLVQNVGVIPAQSEVSIPVTVEYRAAPAPNSVNRLSSKGVHPLASNLSSLCGCLKQLNLNVQYTYPCGGNNISQQRGSVFTPLCAPVKVKSCLDKLGNLLGSNVNTTGPNLVAAGCNAISGLLTCAVDLDPCVKTAISTLCGALVGGVAGAASSGLSSLPACICAHLSDIPLPTFPPSPPPDLSNVTYGSGGNFGYFASGFPIITGFNINTDCPKTQAVKANIVRQIIAAALPLNLQAPVKNDLSGGVCAHIRLRINQDVVLTRSAFTGTLEIDNDGSSAITGIGVTLNFQDVTNGVAADKFITEGPVLNTLTAVDGTGSLDGGASGSATYTFIPTLSAAPDAPATFQIGGTLSYWDGGEQVVVPLLSAPITVYPEAKLDLVYFQQRDVYGDDPFTPQVEPSEPFYLGLIVKNSGAGNAHHFRITSSQPQIVDNEKGLLIDFSIIGTQVGDQQVTPSLTADLGDLPPGAAKEVNWALISSLQGKFISFIATFEHVNDLGNTNTSLINSVTIHELIHPVLANRSTDDDVVDFLVNDIPDPDHLPDTLYLSDGSVAPVNVVTNGTFAGSVGAGHLQVQLTATVSNGWNYFQLPDPGPGYLLAGVVRSDGEALALTNNAWTTDRSFPASGTAAVQENLLHLFDWAGSGAYTLTYRSTNTTPPAIVQLGPVTPFTQPGAVSSVNIVFSEPVDVSTFNSDALTLTRNGGANLISSGSGVMMTLVSDATYVISGLQTLTVADGNYQLTFNGSGINDLWGNNGGNISAAVQWTKGNAPVVVQALDAISPNPRNVPITSVNVTFSKAVNPAAFDYHALSLTLNGGPNLITSAVTIAPWSGNTYVINGLGSLTGGDGNYQLTVNAAAIEDAGGTLGFGTQSTAWTLVTTGPRIVALEQLATNPRNIVVRSLNVTFAQPIDPATFDYQAVTLSLNGGPNLIASDVTVTPLNATTYKIANFNWVVGLPGTYTLTVNAAGLSDLAGNAGAGSTNETWQMILETPASPTNLCITPDTGISATDGLTDTNSIVLSGTVAATNLTVRLTDQTSGADLGTAAVNGTNFTAALTFTTVGQHQLKLTAVDMAANVSAPAYFNVFLDMTPPTAIIQAVTSQVSWPVTNLLVTFSKAINTNTISAANFTLTRDGANAVTPGIAILSSNAVLVTGLTAPTTPIGSYQLTLNLAGIQDLAGNSSARTVSMSWLNVPANQPPVIVQEPNLTAQPGQPFQRQIQATDPEGNDFTFSLAPGAPAGAVITTNGLFDWTPACDQGGTTNLITISATDNGLPPASSSMAFTISVGDCLQIGVGSTVVQVGTTGSVPVTVFSSAGVTNLSFILAYPTNRFANWTIAASNSVVGTATAQTLDSAQAIFNVTAAAGGSLQGSALLGSVFFKALPAPSAFVPLTVASAAGTKSDQSAVGSIVTGAGRVVVIGAQSLLEAKIEAGSQRQVVLYGNPGDSYQLAYTTNLAGTNWLPIWRVPMTNLYQTFGVGDVVPQVFYRAWEFSANPPILELHLPAPTNASLLLYGQNGTNYVIETTTNLNPGTIWFPLTNLVMSNSFQFVPVGDPTNRTMFFRARH
jgi:hypothetical protein